MTLHFPFLAGNTERRVRALSSPAYPLSKEQDPMIRTIHVAGNVTAQGAELQRQADGRVYVDVGGRAVLGWPLETVAKAAPKPSVLQGWRLLVAGTAIALSGLLAAQSQAETLLNVSYDPTRELYREFNEAFTAHWVGLGNEAPTIEQSHGGSGSQARAVIDGLQANVVTLALASDINKIAEAGLLPENWQTLLPHNSSPYTSTIVFLVREGNPRGIQDWGDLLNDGIQVITPNPKTSGGARWNYLAAWAWAEDNGRDPKEFVGELYKHVPVLDSGARGSTTTFAERGIGDVLLAWENEAYLALEELGEDQFDIVVPSVSVLAEPPVALVAANNTSDTQRALSQAYLDFLYSPEGQAIAFKHYYRAWDVSAANPDDVARFPELKLYDIEHFGGWAKVQPEHFGDGGIFDQIYVAQ